MGLLRRLLRHDSRPLARGDSWGAFGQAPGGHWANTLSGAGGPTDRARHDEYVAGPPVDMWLADSLLETNAIAHRIAAQEPEDATREGYDLVRPGAPRGAKPERLDAEIADAVEEACEAGSDGRGLGLLSCLARARTWARAHGGGAIVPLVDDGRQPWEPIDRANIRRVVGLLDADRWELPVVEWGRDGQALTYQLQLNRPGGGLGSMRVHRDRVIRLDGKALPRRRSMVRQGWGASVFDAVFRPLANYGVTLAETQEAVRKLNQGVLTMTAMGAGLEVEGGAELIQARLVALSKALGTYNEVAIGQGESYQIHNRSISGIGDAVKAAVDALVAAADGLPRLKLLGEVTAGFSNASDGELRAWYDLVAAQQPVHYTPAVSQVVRLVMLSHEGPTQGRLVPFGVQWRPLWALSETEAAARDLSRSQRRQVDISSTAISAAEARQDPALIELYGIETEPSAPLAPATEEPDVAVDPGGVNAAADLALNGAQAQALVSIVQSVVLGEIPRASGVEIIKAMLPSMPAAAERIVATAGTEAFVSTAAPPIQDLPDQPVEDEIDPDLAPAALPSHKPMPPDLLSCKDAAAMAGISTAKLKRMCRSGELDYWDFGGQWRVSAADLARLGQAHVGP